MELNREEIKEGNEAIAKFIGWFQQESQSPNTWWENIGSANYIAYSTHDNYPHSDLPFHRDWNYLMKVVDKIGTVVYHREDDAPEWNWKDHYSLGELFHHMWNKWMRIEQAKSGEFNLMNDLTTVWLGCVAYIDWYNNENN
jgi:hypothetical protein